MTKSQFLHGLVLVLLIASTARPCPWDEVAGGNSGWTSPREGLANTLNLDVNASEASFLQATLRYAEELRRDIQSGTGGSPEAHLQYLLQDFQNTFGYAPVAGARPRDGRYDVTPSRDEATTLYIPYGEDPHQSALRQGLTYIGTDRGRDEYRDRTGRTFRMNENGTALHKFWDGSRPASAQW
jgi:hypothetical protein